MRRRLRLLTSPTLAADVGNTDMNRIGKQCLLDILVAATLMCSGCGTIITLSDMDKEGTKHGLVYSGIRFDCRGAFDPAYMQHIPFGKPLCVIDMPLSLVADTVVLPYTGVKTLIGRKTTRTNAVPNQASQAIGAPSAPQPER